MIEAEERKKLDALYEYEKRKLEADYKWLRLNETENLEWAKREASAAYEQLLSPDDSAQQRCRMLYEQLEALSRDIGSAIERLNLPDVDYDDQRTRVDALRAEYDRKEPVWRECRDQANASTPGYGERQRKYLALAKLQVAADIRRNQIESRYQDALKQAAISYQNDIDWLAGMKKRCRSTGTWSVRVGGGVEADCACLMSSKLDELKSYIGMRRTAEQGFDAKARELDKLWDRLNLFLTARAEKLKPEATDWVYDAMNLAVDANLTIWDMAAAGKLDFADSAEEATEAGAEVARSGEWRLVDELARSYRDENQSLVTATGRTVKNMGKEVATSWNDAFKLAAGRNSGTIAGGIKSLQGIMSAEAERVQQDLLRITKLQMEAADQLTNILTARHDEITAWNALLALP